MVYVTGGMGGQNEWWFVIRRTSSNAKTKDERDNLTSRLGRYTTALEQFTKIAARLGANMKKIDVTAQQRSV